MIHPFVSEHLAEALREHGLDLPGLLWLPYHDDFGGACVAAEVGPGVRLLVHARPRDSYVGEDDAFQLDDRTASGGAEQHGHLSRRFTETGSLVRLLRRWATEATTRHNEALAAYRLSEARMKGMSRALDAIGHLAPAEPGVEASAPTADANATPGGRAKLADELDAEARRLRRAVATGDLGARSGATMGDAACVAEADRLAREAARIRATAALTVGP